MDDKTKKRGIFVACCCIVVLSFIHGIKRAVIREPLRYPPVILLDDAMQSASSARMAFRPARPPHGSSRMRFDNFLADRKERR